MSLLTAATSADISAVLTLLIEIAKAVLSCVSDVVDVVMANPLLLIPIGIVMLFTIIKVFKSLF